MNATPTTLPEERVFRFDHTEVRTAVDENGAAWFVARDVFAVLSIPWKGTGSSLKTVPEHRKGTRYYGTPGGVQSTVFLSESGVYQVILRSKKPEAIAFERWIFDDVLPEIRRTGRYGTPQLTASEEVRFRTLLAATIKELSDCPDVFRRAFLIDEAKEVAARLGKALPDLALLGPQQGQLPLGGAA